MATAATNTASDFNQWLHAMKMVARLPGGMPPEFRRKLWLALAEQHLQSKSIDWSKEEDKCMCEEHGEDDEELGIQIVKDLHRTGSSLCSGPAGSVNQGKLKRVLLGYARWNPEVGYCQGFNMLGALILQVMDKDDVESLKVMIFLVEGILPTGYFSGSLGGLQADMAVFREILGGRLPKLAKHLQRLQGPIGEGILEPPLTNVFTMQWFLTLFCTCLPINCVLRVWDLVLIEGSDILLRTALAIWGLLEERILATKSADDFYCKMGLLSGELLNGHLFDSNGLIQKVVDLGPIPELQKMRDKHLYNVTPWKDKRGLRFFFSDDEGDSDDEARLEVSTAWGLRLGRRGSFGMPTSVTKPASDGRDRIALDISILKRQYEKLRERQRQAHIILTSTSRPNAEVTVPTLPVNQYLLGRSAIVSSKGRRIGPPAGAIPPARKVQSLKTSSKSSSKPQKKNEPIPSKEATGTRHQVEESPSSDNKESENNDTAPEPPIFPLKKSSSVASTASSTSEVSATSASKRSHKKSESSSYSEDSDGNSSTSTSLCDDDNFDGSHSSVEVSPLRKPVNAVESEVIEMLKTSKLDECIITLNKQNLSENCEILTCVTGQHSEDTDESIQSCEKGENRTEDVREKEVKLEVICEESFDVTSPEIETSELEKEFSNPNNTKNEEEEDANQDTNIIHQENEGFESLELNEDSDRKNKEPQSIGNRQVKYTDIDLMEMYQSNKNTIQRIVDKKSSTSTFLDEDKPVNVGMLQFPEETMQDVQPYSCSSSQEYHKNRDISQDEVSKVATELTNEMANEESMPNELKPTSEFTPNQDANINALANEATDTNSNFQEYMKTIHPIDLSEVKDEEEGVLKVLSPKDNQEAIITSKDNLENISTFNYDLSEMTMLQDKKSNLHENQPPSFRQNKDIKVDSSISEKRNEEETCTEERIEDETKGVSLLKDFKDIVQESKETGSSNSNENKVSTQTEPIRLAREGNDLSLSESPVIFSQFESQTRISSSNAIDFVDKPDSKIKREESHDETSSDDKQFEIIRNKPELLETIPTNKYAANFKTIDSSKSVPKNECIDSLEASSRVSASDKPDELHESLTATVERSADKNLLLEHLLDPILGDKADIDDVLIKHFTSIKSEQSQPISKEPAFDFESIEDIRRKYYASANHKSDELDVESIESSVRPLMSTVEKTVSPLGDSLSLKGQTTKNTITSRTYASDADIADKYPSQSTTMPVLMIGEDMSKEKLGDPTIESPLERLQTKSPTLKSPEIIHATVPSPTQETSNHPSVTIDQGTVSESTVRSISSSDIKEILLKAKQSPTAITSTSQLSPIVDFPKYLRTSSISPLRTPISPCLKYTQPIVSETAIATAATTDSDSFKFKVNDEGVTNEYFERVTVPERPSRLELRSSTSDDATGGVFINNDLTRNIHVNAFVCDSPQHLERKSGDDVFEESFAIRPHAINIDHSFLKEKSISLDEPAASREEFKPSSCPENVTENNYGEFRKSERVSRIIQENSMILHRLLKRHVCLDDSIRDDAIRNEKERADFNDSLKKSGTSNEINTNALEKTDEVIPVALEVAKSPTCDTVLNNKVVLAGCFPPDQKRSCCNTAYSENLKTPDINAVPQQDEQPPTELHTASLIENSNNNTVDEEDAKYETTCATINANKSIDIIKNDSNCAGSTINSDTIEVKETCNTSLDTAPIQTPISSRYGSAPPEDISETISSIKNTIKSIDSLCKRDDRDRRGIDKTMDIIESMNEIRFRKNDLSKSTIELDAIPDLDIEVAAPSSRRFSRDIRREISPRRCARDSEREEYESLFKRDTSMSRSTSVLPSNSLESDLDRLYRLSEHLGSHTSEDPSSFSRNSFPPINFSFTDTSQSYETSNPSVRTGTLLSERKDCNVMSLSPSSTPPPRYTPPEKRIRHTTVTSTFYDRIKAQQKERTVRFDRSPTSNPPPVTITKAYLNSLRLTPSDSCDGKSLKSAGSSPSRHLKKNEYSGSWSTIVVPPFRKDLNYKSSFKSCDNIPQKVTKTGCKSESFKHT